MSWPGERAESERRVDFFVSYSPADERWASWIAWQLQAEGHQVLIQAWHFEPGTNFTDFTDRGIREAAVVVVVLSGSYLRSQHGTRELQVALRTDPAKVVVVRVDDCPVAGPLVPISRVDLADVDDPEVARTTLLHRLLGGRTGLTELGVPLRRAGRGGLPGIARRVPLAPPAFPRSRPSGPVRRESVSILHVAGPRFGRGTVTDDEPLTAQELQSRIRANVSRLTDTGAPAPELLVVSGDLTESARPRQVEEAMSFLTGLRVLLNLEPRRMVVVPGGHDVSPAACQAYFLQCEARDREPNRPYFPKLELYASLFAELYQGLDELVFDSAQPWTLFAVPDSRVVVAAMNSTMAMSHRPEDDHGLIGEEQAAWFSERLRPFEESGWLRVGVTCHDPTPGARLAGPHPALLQDAELFDRMLGTRLNLLLHGPGRGGTRIDVLDSGLPAVSAAVPGRDEIIEVTQEGLRRHSVYADGAGDRGEHLARQWHAVDATFATTAPAGLTEPAGEVPPDEPSPADDPHGRLLDRVAEVSATRHEGAKIRRVRTRPPHLVVTRHEDGFTPQWRVGAHVGEVTGEALEEFLRHDPGQGDELVYLGPAPAPRVREQAARHGVRLRSFAEFQGLLDLDDYVGKQTVRLLTDRRYPPELYVPQRFRELDRSSQEIKSGLVDELVRLVTDDHGRFVLVVGDFGRGKTFVLHEAARRIAESTTAVIPILIELRELDKLHSVAGLVAAHLANHGEDRIDLRAFNYMLREGRIVLLFDGFDELVTRVTYDRAADHLRVLLKAAQDKAKIVVAGRTQHFKSQAQVFTALGEQVGMMPNRRILGIEDFTPAQIRAYLVNRYGGDEQQADARLELLSGVQDLLGLATNPRMLTFIADLDEERVRAAVSARHTLSAAALYREILHNWLRHEAARVAGGPGALPGLGVDELWTAVTALALRLWRTGESFVRLAELAEVADALTGLGSGMSREQAAQAIGAGSLLVRTDDGSFGFIHSSVTEWLVANAMARRFATGAPAELARHQLSQLSVDFLCDIADTGVLQDWSDRVLTDGGASNAARANAIKVSTRLRTPTAADLRGASLAGEDLSHRDLQDVDLTGADLTGARLVGTNLSGAVLRDARLVAARFDQARLTGADLRGADFSRARLPGADLTGARVAGSRWHRAALVAATGVPDAPELRGAAVAPGHPVAVELAPASIGVRHGFHPELGRLPQVLAYSAGGDTIAVGSDDGGVLICDTETGLPLRTLTGHRDRVFAVTYNGAHLVTGSGDGQVRVWDPATGECLRILDGHRRWPWPVVIDPAGHRLATGDSEGMLRLWDLESGALRHELPSDRGFTVDVAWHGQLVAAAYRDGSVRLWDAGTGASLGELVGVTGSVHQVAFSPAGDLLATGGQSGAIRLWDPATGHPVGELAGHDGGVHTLAFHPGGHLLASGDTEGEVRIWDLPARAVRHTVTGHGAAIYWVTFSPAGDLLATGDSAGVVNVWDIATGRSRHRLTAHTGSVWPFAFRPDGRQLAISDDQFTTRLWDPVSGECLHTLAGHGRQVTAVRFDATGGLLATSGNDGVARLWDPGTGKQVRRLTGSEDRLLTVETAIFSRSSSRLATVTNDGRLTVLSLDTGRAERHINVESPPVWAVAFSPSGAQLATANDDDTVRLWYRTTGRLELTLAEHRGRVRSIAFSRDGTLIATGCDDSNVRLWDASTGKLLRVLSGHTDRVYAVSFGDGVLASASWDTTARVWDVESGRTLHVLDRHTARLWTAAFTRAGDLLATAGDDLVIRLWDPVTGTHLHSLVGHTRSVLSVEFDPAGDLLASGGGDGTVRLWSVGGGGRPETTMTLLGLPEGWAAVAPDGRYKIGQEVGGQFWHVIGMCRFEMGELDPYLRHIRQVPADRPF
jgi:WD40 repeat protein/uncharacterized protein YjbI with pentapeptide repeats/3',5'-cyclic AMP phosphodiesterase CpdA